MPRILEVLCRSTGMGFAAVARVTESRWIACSVRDEIAFGLLPGGELEVESTLCHEVREARETVAIDHVAEDAVYCAHHTPAKYGFQSYVSTPIFLADGSFFGTLCAIDPRPASVKNPTTLGMFQLFAELIGLHLETIGRLDVSEASLLEERQTAELREQFIAVLGHDLRNPLGAIVGSAQQLSAMPLDVKASSVVERIKRSGRRMEVLIEDALDLARGRLGGGVALNFEDVELEPLLQQIVSELRVSNPDRQLETQWTLSERVSCDRSHLGQLFSNLLANAATHGAADQAIRVQASTQAGFFEFSVENGGEPIPEAARERLFHPFFRGAVRKNQQGLGLGLYISSEIARAHGGSLKVESGAAGTRFSFRMPLRG